jgi:hypothetical protein
MIYVHLLYEFLAFLFVLRFGSDSVVEFMSTYYMSNTVTTTSHHEQEDKELI